MNCINFCFTLFGLLSNQMTQCSARGLSSIELKICISDSLTWNLFKQPVWANDRINSLVKAQTLFEEKWWLHGLVLATKKCFIQVKLALVNSHDCSHATAFPLQIKTTILAIRTFLCNISKRFSPTLLLNRTDLLYVIYFKFSKFIPCQLDIFHESVPQCLSFLITLLAFTL